MMCPSSAFLSYWNANNENFHSSFYLALSYYRTLLTIAQLIGGLICMYLYSKTEKYIFNLKSTIPLR